MFTKRMGFGVLFLSLIVSPRFGFAQGAPATAPAASTTTAPLTAQAASSPEKLSDIRKLISLTGGDQLGQQMIEQMVQSFKESFPKTPADFWNEFLDPANANQLTELNVPIYDKYLSQEEIKEIIRFYESPTGKKLIEVLPQISQESYQSGEQWGYNLGMKVRDKLIKGGFLKEEAAENKPGNQTVEPSVNLNDAIPMSPVNSQK